MLFFQRTQPYLFFWTFLYQAIADLCLRSAGTEFSESVANYKNHFYYASFFFQRCPQNIVLQTVSNFLQRVSLIKLCLLSLLVIPLHVLIGVRNKYLHAFLVDAKKSFHADSNNWRSNASCTANGKRQFRERAIKVLWIPGMPKPVHQFRANLMDTGLFCPRSDSLIYLSRSCPFCLLFLPTDAEYTYRRGWRYRKCVGCMLATKHNRKLPFDHRRELEAKKVSTLSTVLPFPPVLKCKTLKSIIPWQNPPLSNDTKKVTFTYSSTGPPDLSEGSGSYYLMTFPEFTACHMNIFKRNDCRQSGVYARATVLSLQRWRVEKTTILNAAFQKMEKGIYRCMYVYFLSTSSYTSACKAQLLTNSVS